MIEWAPRDPLEQRAWSATAGDGAWRFHWYTEKDGDKHISVRRPEGLVISEALARACASDEGEREALVQLLASIETGAITGAHRKTETEQERAEEEGGHD